MMVAPKDMPDELIDALLANYENPDDLLGTNGILEQLTKRVVERALQAKMTHHLTMINTAKWAKPPAGCRLPHSVPGLHTRQITFF